MVTRLLDLARAAPLYSVNIIGAESAPLSRSYAAGTSRFHQLPHRKGGDSFH